MIENIINIVNIEDEEKNDINVMEGLIKNNLNETLNDNFLNTIK